MPRVTTNGPVTIPIAIQEALGIEPGDKTAFEAAETGYRSRKEARRPPRETIPSYRGSADSDRSSVERMYRLRVN